MDAPAEQPDEKSQICKPIRIEEINWPEFRERHRSLLLRLQVDYVVENFPYDIALQHIRIDHPDRALNKVDLKEEARRLLTSLVEGECEDATGEFLYADRDSDTLALYYAAPMTAGVNVETILAQFDYDGVCNHLLPRSCSIDYRQNALDVMMWEAEGTLRQMKQKKFVRSEGQILNGKRVGKIMRLYFPSAKFDCSWRGAQYDLLVGLYQIIYGVSIAGPSS